MAASVECGRSCGAVGRWAKQSAAIASDRIDDSSGAKNGTLGSDMQLVSPRAIKKSVLRRCKLARRKGLRDCRRADSDAESTLEWPPWVSPRHSNGTD